MSGVRIGNIRKNWPVVARPDRIIAWDWTMCFAAHG